MEPPRWKTITPSQYEWERRGLDFIRLGLPDHDPYRAWSNFEFQSGDGAIYEVDLLVLTKQGFWLVECKAWNGRISGDVTKLADAAFEQAAVKVVERARRFGTSVFIWRDGQIKKLRPQDIKIVSPNHKRKRGYA